MLVCFTSDLHGRPGLYDQLDNLLRAQRPEVLIVGGDVLADGDIDDPIGTQVAYIDEVFMPRVTRWQGELPGLLVACVLGNHDWLCARLALQSFQPKIESCSILNRHSEWRIEHICLI